MTNNEVLISGAGLAGPALAFWLHRHGFRPTVVERAPALRDGGYKVDVRGAATEVLKRMGVYDAARALDTGMRQITYVRRDGRPLAVLDANLVMGRRGDDIEIMRTDLTRVLHEATTGFTEYVFGDAIASISDGPDGVDVTFEKGAPRRFALVVGADGLHSATRRMVLGEVPLIHLGAYISIFTVPNHLRLDREEMMYSEPGRMVGAYSTGPSDPAKAGFTFAAPELSFDRRDVEAQKQLVVNAFANCGWEASRMLESIDDADDFYLDSISQIELPRWSAGRVALIGDAASCPAPSSGQGTSLALVGAYMLAGELAEAGGDHTAAFAAYETAMRPYVDKNLAFGRKMARDMVPGGRFQIAFRNYGMRTLKYHPRKEQVIERVLRPLREAANAIELRSYRAACSFR
jgi:2-polyprenyl-6-methoxyphenol hydroxylase-like FAD-dependent oxidoreductase